MFEESTGDPEITGPAGEADLSIRGQRTRASVVAAARLVFERDGYLEARITDISSAAGVAHGTFYTYFDSKEAVFRAIIVALRADMLESATGRSAREPSRQTWGAIRDANRRYLEAFHEHRGILLLWDQVAALDPAIAQLLAESKQPFVLRSEQTIRHLQATGDVGRDIDPRYAAHALTGMVSRFAHAWFEPEEMFDLDVAVEQLTLLWANALGLKRPETLPGDP